MKISWFFGTLFLSIYILFSYSCSKEKAPKDIILIDTVRVSSSVKGWGLYSWKDQNDWYYTVLYGTNRTKTIEEIQFISSTALQVAKLNSVESLKNLFSRLAPKENIMWYSCVEASPSFSLPPENIINEIKDYCLERQLELTILHCK